METIKNILVKYFSQLLLIVTIVGVATLAYSLFKKTKRMHQELIGTREKYKQVTEYTAKLESNYKSQLSLYKKSKKEWSEVNKKLTERIKLLSDATYLIGRHVERQDGPDYYYHTKRNTRNYVLNELRLQGKNSPPIGYILIKNDGRTYKRNYRFEIQVKTLQTVDENSGRVKVYTKAFLIQKEPSLLKKRIKGYNDFYNKPYPLKIVGGTAFIDPTTKNYRKDWILWAPHINGGFSFNGSSIRPTLDLSIGGYGVSKNDLQWKLLHLGINSDNHGDNIGFHITPFSYRFYPSLLSNTYIGPSISWNADGSKTYYININLGF